MDLFSKIIKRPLSLTTVTGNNDGSSPTSALGTDAATLVNRGESTLLSLTELLDSAAQDLNQLEEHHKNLIVMPPPLPLAPPSPRSPISTSRDSIQQLLSSINVNLNQVSAHEMEHLQAMSAELSPLAVKANTKPTMDQPQQKIVAVAAALRSSDPSTVIVPPIGGVSGLTFGGLPEFDETQIPELAPLSADMLAVHLKSEAGAGAGAGATSVVHSLNSTHDYNSDSDVYVECLSLHSDKRFSNDPAELEAYTSALNEVLEEQEQEDAKLNNTISGVTANPNCSYEPMDVDELNETMEILKDVMAPEDHQLLKEQLMSDVVEKAKEILTTDPLGEANQPELIIKEDKVVGDQVFTVGPQNTRIEMQQLQSELQQPEKSNETEQQHLDNEPSQVSREEVQTMEKNDSQLEIHEHSLVMEPLKFQMEDPLLNMDQDNEKQESQVKTNQQDKEEQHQPPHEQKEEEKEKPLEEIMVTPTVPLEEGLQENITQSEKTEPKEELEFLALKELPGKNESQLNIKEEPKVIPIAFVTPTRLPTSIPTFSAAPISPTFPVKDPAEPPSHFPHSPHAPAEEEEMPYLEKAVIEPFSEDKESICGGVIAKSPLAINVIQASPENKEIEHLNETLPMDGIRSPLTDFNGDTTFDSSKEKDTNVSPSMATAAAPLEPRGTFSVPLKDANSQERRTFSVNASLEEASHEKKEMEPIYKMASSSTAFNGDTTFDSGKGKDTNATVSIGTPTAPLEPTTTFVGVPLTDAKSQERRTFTLNTSLEEQQQTQRTFLLKEPLQLMDIPSNIVSSEHPSEIKNSSKNFCLEEPKEEKSRRTFTVQQQLKEDLHASPAQEATEEDDFEPMDVDMSIRVAETTVSKPEPEPEPSSPPIPTLQKKLSLAPAQPAVTLRSSSPPIPTHQSHDLKRPPIHYGSGNATMIFDEQTLSAKEQATLSASDEKDDVFMEHFGAISPVSDDMFKTPQYTSNSFNNLAKLKFNSQGETSGGVTRPNIVSNRTTKPPTGEQFFDAEFEDGGSNNNIILNSSDFDYLYTKGNNNEPVDRSSLLLKFDPLLGAAVPVNSRSQQQELAQLNIFGGNSNNSNNRVLSPTLEEHETSGSNQSFAIEPSAKLIAKELEFKPPVDRTKKHAKMSVDVIDNDCNKTFDNSNLNTEDKANNYHNMDELEKKIKNEVTRSEDIEKKLKDAEQREEALIKRITEKDKINSKLNGVIEAYEKAIAELISEKEQLVQNFERQLQEVQADRDSNYHHLTSLETTFSDLHVKYEKSKEMTSHLRQVEETLLAEKKQTAENLQLQEQRYEKMKSHAMQQLEIANKKLDSSTKEHADEVKKLKALLKKEEVSRVSTAEQLQQKSRENADLLKICEELIYGKGQGGSS